MIFFFRLFQILSILFIYLFIGQEVGGGGSNRDLSNF